jgi:hypothetical protein
MMHRFLACVILVFGSLSLMAQEPASTNEFDLNVVSKKYSDTWRQIESLREERLSTVKTQYLGVLDNLYQKSISKGDLDAVIAVKSEKDRILTDVSPTDAERTAMPEELNKSRAAYDQHAVRIVKEQGDQLRQLYDRYKKLLELQERKLTVLGRVDDALAVRAEKERMMDDLPAVASAQPAGPAPAAPATTADPFTNAAATATTTYTFYKPGAEPHVDQKDMQKLQTFSASPQSRAAGMVYTLDVGVITAKGKLQTTKNTSTGWYTKTEAGTVFHKPRIWITGRNKSIEAGSKLVIEYFSSNIETSGRQKDCIEIIVLPAIAQGKTVVVDGKGIGLYKNESEQNWGGGASKSKQGREFDGLIVSIYGKDGTALFQQMTSQTLDKEVSPTLPLEKPCPQDPQPAQGAPRTM